MNPGKKKQQRARRLAERQRRRDQPRAQPGVAADPPPVLRLVQRVDQPPDLHLVQRVDPPSDATDAHLPPGVMSGQTIAQAMADARHLLDEPGDLGRGPRHPLSDGCRRCGAVPSFFVDFTRVRLAPGEPDEFDDDDVTGLWELSLCVACLESGASAQWLIDKAAGRGRGRGGSQAA